MNLVYGLACHEAFFSSLFRASDLLRKVTGSIIVGDPDFFFCPAFVTWWSHRFSYNVVVYFEWRAACPYLNTPPQHIWCFPSTTTTTATLLWFSSNTTLILMFSLLLDELGRKFVLRNWVIFWGWKRRFDINLTKHLRETEEKAVRNLEIFPVYI